ncbi:biotin-dependent carboxyltransferase family protein [Bordetella sp. FB-8]|uniref:5-oxoprolinase subunit C family protein n=1 Tax=Bordetella sp. FB-8 TaxID=1159870 RepID=UPI000372F6A5|nr:biotin-dependent carboxyltransferase family protein [Bordetella sp. FB-8]
MSITVLKPGLQSSFQDRGRIGYQHLGVPVNGAMDERAHRLASLLVGNPATRATLEITLVGPVLRFNAPACFALAGADLGACLNGDPIPAMRPHRARAGDLLTFSSRAEPGRGLRAYLAVHGGYAIEPVMGSESTYLRGGFGGLQGRALDKGDVIGLRRPLRGTDAGLAALETAMRELRLYLPATLVGTPRAALRVLPGSHWDLFDAESQVAFVQTEFRVSPASDRMGYRLTGPGIHQTSAAQMLSEAACFGSVQVPADGQPIVLMADRQTTGGYAKIAQVISIDLPLLAQYAPGQGVRFTLTTLEDAQRLDQAREQAYAALETALAPLRAQLLARAQP